MSVPRLAPKDGVVIRSTAKDPPPILAKVGATKGVVHGWRDQDPTPIGDLWRAFERSLRRPPVPLGPDESPDLLVAAHEWSLATPLSIRSDADIKSKPHLKVEPFRHQVEGLKNFFNRLFPSGLVADDVGLGKTVTAGLILLELLVRRKVQSFLVVAPKLILPQWERELREKFGVQAEIVSTGKEFKQLRSDRVNRAISTYALVRGNPDAVRAANFEMLILDEVHKLRTLTHPKREASQMARVIHELVRSRAFRVCLGLSATPLQNSLWDLHSVAEILRTPNPLGPQDFFLQNFPADDEGRVLHRNMKDEFRRRSSQFMKRTSRKESGLTFPERRASAQVVDGVRGEVDRLDRALRLMRDLGAQPFERSNFAQTVMSSPAAAAESLRAKLGKLGSDTPAGLRDQTRELTQEFESAPSSGKLDFLVELIRELRSKDPQDWRVLVFTIRRRTATFIEKRLKAAGFGDVLAPILGGQDRTNQQTIDDFTANPPRKHIVVSTDAGAEGVNLQACNVVVNFDLPWNPMVVEQRIGRVQRLGQKKKFVVVHNLLTRGTVEEKVVHRLLEKLALFDAAIGMNEEVLGEIDENGEKIQAKILELVEASLAGRNVEKMIAEQAENAKKAREELEAFRRATEDALGHIDPSGVGPEAPQVSPTRPSMPIETFWREGMEALGYRLRETGKGVIVAVHPDARERRFTFDPGHPDRTGPVVLGIHGVEFVGGGERCVEDLARQLARYGADGTTVATLGEPELYLDALAAMVPDRILGPRTLTYLHPATRVQATPIVRVNTSVFHDQYEKIIRPATPLDLELGEVEGDPRNSLVEDVFVAKTLAALRSTVAADPDLQAFRKFYEARRAHEHAQLDRHREEQLTSDGPSPRSGRQADRALEALRDEIDRKYAVQNELRLICWTGRIFERALLRMELEVASGKVVHVELPVSADRSPEDSLLALAGTREPLGLCDQGHLGAQADLKACQAPECPAVACPGCEPWSTCAECARPGCPDHVAPCEACGRVVCEQHVAPLDTQERACPGCVGTCQLSGRRLLKSRLVTLSDTGQLVAGELARDDAVTGLPVLAATMVESALSGRRAAPSQAARCERSGRLVLTDEIAPCSLSGVRMAKDLLAPCAVTGRVVERTSLEPCQATGRLCVPDTLLVSSVSGARVHPDQIVASTVTGRLATRAEMGASALSGKPALPDELVASELSGRRVLPEETSRCPESERLAVQDELVPCARSGALVDPALLVECHATRSRVLRRLVVPCEATGKLALPDQMLRSELSGKRVLPDLLVPSVVSGRLALPDEMFRSPVSGLLAFPQEAIECEETGDRVLPQDTAICVLSRQRVRIDRLVKSERSGRYALAKMSARCDVCRKLVLDDELESCAETGRRAEPGCMKPSDLSAKLAIAETLRRCELTGRSLLSTEVGTCERSRRVIGKDRIGRCEISGKLVGDDLLASCAVTGKRALATLLAASQVSGKLGLPGMMITSPSGVVLLPSEVVPCPLCSASLAPAPFRARETIRCDSCQQVVCIAHTDPATSGRTYCRLCVAVLGRNRNDPCPKEVIARYPNAARWSGGIADHYGVAVGEPGFLASFVAEAWLYAFDRSGRILHERAVDPTDDALPGRIKG